jgi:hypothetical protein
VKFILPFLSFAFWIWLTGLWLKVPGVWPAPSRFLLRQALGACREWTALGGGSGTAEADLAETLAMFEER